MLYFQYHTKSGVSPYQWQPGFGFSCFQTQNLLKKEWDLIDIVRQPGFSCFQTQNLFKKEWDLIDSVIRVIITIHYIYGESTGKNGRRLFGWPTEIWHRNYMLINLKEMRDGPLITIFSHNTDSISKELFGSPPLNFRALKILVHFNSLLRSKALIWGGLKFKANFRTYVWSFALKFRKEDPKQGETV